MRRAVVWTAVFVLAMAFLACRGDSVQDLHIAVASSLTLVAEELEDRYATQTGVALKISTGASGTLYAQIASGAPFDIFLSADQYYPQRMVDQGLAFEDSLRTYCYGILVIWAGRNSGIDPLQLRWHSLSHPAARRIAIANPSLAPYGRAALQLIKKHGIAEEVNERIVVGENVSQAAHFGASGAAQVALIPLSLAKTEVLQRAGSFWRIPQPEYPRIEQAAVILKTAGDRRESAQGFLDWLFSPEAGEILSSAGFLPAEPGEKGNP